VHTSLSSFSESVVRDAEYRFPVQLYAGSVSVRPRELAGWANSKMEPSSVVDERELMLMLIFREAQ